jgi:epoxyqueuosine reductase
MLIEGREAIKLCLCAPALILLPPRNPRLLRVEFSDRVAISSLSWRRFFLVNQTEQLKQAARIAGADLVGLAGLGPFIAEGALLPPDTCERFTSAVSVAIHLDDSVIDGIEGVPTPAYASHYRAINAKLDHLTALLATWITAQGFSARAVPATEILDSSKLCGSISHKAVARMAGIGWQGKSLLIVTPQYGPRVRLATLLTDLPLTPDGPLKNRCGTCNQCAQACPASAIKNVRTADRYANREDALHLSRCVEQTLAFKAEPGIGAQVCGICVKVCPFGKRKRQA